MQAGAVEVAAAPEETAVDLIAEAEKDFFDFINKERKRIERESNQLRVSVA